ncbi:hypothetical protein [Sphingobacterium hungaricum]
MKIIVVILGLLFSPSFQESDETLVRNSLISIEKGSNEEVVDKYLILTETSDSLQIADRKEYLNLVLDDLRDTLKIKPIEHIKITRVTDYFDYDIDTDESGFDHLMIVSYKNEKLLSVLTHNNKIKSFTGMRKGETETFFFY